MASQRDAPKGHTKDIGRKKATNQPINQPNNFPYVSSVVRECRPNIDARVGGEMTTAG